MVKKNTIPDGWRNVQPVGQPIPGTRFIAFKVPLKGVINHRLTPTQKFTPKDLIAAMKMLNVELGLIIDLTYTTRYYDVKDLPKSLEYKKLFTVGHEVPDDATILQFKKWVRKFLWENADNEKLIGVHCTNGINRTGYLICRYLIDVEGWEPGTAIQGACLLLELNPRFCMLASVALVGIEIPSSRNATCEGEVLNLLSVVLRHPRKSCF